ncbi:MAG: TIGR03943 family protein [Andreesenia angusta]|nr:TIGR03943 family protein [Andreesenia angusta]
MNINNLLKSIISILYGLVFLYLFLTEKLYLYIHPRMGKYILIAGIILLIVGIYSLKDIRRDIYLNTSILPFFILLIPLISGLIIDPNEVYSMISNKCNFNFQSIQANEEKTNFLKEDGSIEIRSDNYIYAIKEIYYNIDKYKGKNIEFEGFLYRNQFMNQNQAMVGRNIITCCIADASLLGYMVEGNILTEIPDNQWVKIDGRLDILEFEKDQIPFVKVDKNNIKFPKRPKNQYIFAN